MDINFPVEPPVNNLIQPDIYDRIGALTVEKIRVANTQLNTRLSIQERVINKYKIDAERLYTNQRRKVRREMRKIKKKKPDYVGEFDIATGSKGQGHKSDAGSRHRSLSEGSDSSYCRRYYSHHYNIKDSTREQKTEQKKKRTEKGDYFNARLRCYFLSMSCLNRFYDTDRPTRLEHPGNDHISEAEDSLENEVFHLPDDIRAMTTKDYDTMTI